LPNLPKRFAASARPTDNAGNRSQQKRLENDCQKYLQTLQNVGSKTFDINKIQGSAVALTMLGGLAR